MMFEKQFSVGDYVKLDDIEGTVTATAMRVTYLKNFAGQQIIIPNGSIGRVINYSRMDSLAKVTVSTPYEADSRQAVSYTHLDVYKRQSGARKRCRAMVCMTGRWVQLISTVCGKRLSKARAAYAIN